MVIYTWAEFERDSNIIAEWAKDKGFRGVYGIPKAGVFLADMLAYRLKIPLLLNPEEIRPDTLVVDDISDDGKVITKLEGRLSFVPTLATLFFHKDTLRMPNFTLREKKSKEEKDWIKFPWETEESSRYDGTFS